MMEQIWGLARALICESSANQPPPKRKSRCRLGVRICRIFETGHTLSYPFRTQLNALDTPTTTSIRQAIHAFPLPMNFQSQPR